MTQSVQKFIGIGIAFVLAALLVATSFGLALAGHNGAVVSTDTAACGETTVSATIADPDGTHKVSNMFLVVDVDGDVQFANVPTDGTSADITVGPFFGQTAETKTISWNVFGGGERSYDQPLWNGFGGPTFSADISAYATEQGGFSWVLSGVADPNPFINWNEVEVEGCAVTKDMCKQGGWEALGFKNQGQCVRFVETGKDSRE